jgi:hypothetical protein
LSTVYYCWVCGKFADPQFATTHYETGQPVHFCCAAHRAEYQELADL